MKTFGVYGTLRMGGSREDVMQEAKFVGFDYIEGQLFDTRYGFPALLVNDKGQVLVEVYENVSPDLEEMLNRIEGYSPAFPEQSLYIQKEVNTQGKNVPIFVYEWNNQPGAPIHLGDQIASGDWAEYSGMSVPVPVQG